MVRERRGLWIRCVPLAFTALSCVALKSPSPDPAPASNESDAGSPFEVVHAVPQGPALYGVWAASPSFVVAVGESSTSFVLRDGVLNRLGGDNPGRDYEAVYGVSEDDVFAVGKTADSKGFVRHFDGTAWSAVFDAPDPLLGVWATKTNGKTTVMACGGNGKVYGWFSGSSWKEVVAFPKGPKDPDIVGGPRLWSISGSSLTDFSIVSDGRIWRREGKDTYYYDPDVGSAGLQFRSVWHASSGEYLGTNFAGLAWLPPPTSYDAGDEVHASMVHRDDSIPAADKTFHYGVWGTASKITAVGQSGRIYVYDTGTSEGAFVPAPTDVTLTSISGSSASDVWIVGEREMILHGSVE